MQGEKEWTYELGQPQLYVRELLTLGLCSVFLPERFVSDGEKTIGNCCIEGYRVLAAAEQLSADEILTVSIALLHGIHQAEKHCVFSETFRIEPEYIYVNRDFSEVRLFYVPDSNCVSLKEKILMLLSGLREKCSEESIGYIENAEKFAAEGAYGYRSLLHYFENLRREIYLCGVH